MDQATPITQAGIARIVALILGAGVCIIAVGLAEFVIARRNPRWSRAMSSAPATAGMLHEFINSERQRYETYDNNIFAVGLFAGPPLPHLSVRDPEEV